MLSRTSEYALRAMIYLARHADEQPIPGWHIAKEGEIPRKYLSNLLGNLVRARLLSSSPGKHGGFRLSRPAATIALDEVLALFEPDLSDRRPCPFGNEVCNDNDPCLGHEGWKQVRETYTQFLRTTSIYDVAVRKGPHGSSDLAGDESKTKNSLYRGDTPAPGAEALESG